MKYREYNKLNYAAIGEEILSFWKKNKLFEKSVAAGEGKPTFTFYEGPPSANGTPGIHHVISRTVKDLVCRYKTLKGYQVKRKGGWDTHGLPVELQVEKDLGITKEDIGKKISVEEYNRKCRETVMKYKDQWDDLTEKIGYWVDLDHPYVTFNSEYIETLWWLLKKLYVQGLLYKGYTIQPYSPAAGTGLSSHELNQPGTYKDLKDTSVTAQFKVERNERSEWLFEGEEDLVMLAWTTTPWTLPANSALAIGEKIDYVKVKTFNPYTYQPVSLVLAKDRMSAYFNEKTKDISLANYQPGNKRIPFEVVKEFKGKDLVGMDYEQLMPYIRLSKPGFTVVPGDFVTTEDGTGIVHISKTFGADDYRTCVQFGIPGVMVKDEEGNDVPIVDKKGRYVKEITDFAGMYVKNQYYEDGKAPEKSLDVLIAIKLKEENKAFKVEKYDHPYPHCWRTDKPILYYPLDAWFIKTTARKDALVRLNNTINWKPASTGTGRFGNWLENLVDWNLSRSRFWGTPLPIWVTEDRSEEKCIGSIEELKAEIKKALEAGFMTQDPYAGQEVPDLHRPYVDDVVLVSPGGKKMFREPDLIDVWFDSGAMPYAQWHYPFENKDIFDENYPADFIAEGVDQTRGWFFTLHAIAGMLFDSVAFRNVIANGLVLDKNGNKMSKRLGNAVDPFKTIAEYGPDALRWYMISNANPWDNLKFNPEGIAEVQRRFFGTLYNTYSFFALYANLDGFDYTEKEIPVTERKESDRWILSRLHTIIRQVEEAYEDYEPTKAARLIQDFTIDDLSNWYVRLNRKRFWVGEYSQDKRAAYQTLYTCLLTIAKLSSPVAPFFMERMYKDLQGDHDGAEVSVHLTGFPKVGAGIVNKELEEKMQMAQNISSLVHSLRKKHKIRVRQPLSRVLVPVLNQHYKKQVEAVEELILAEVNVKNIEFVSDDSGVLVKKIKPNFRKLGQEYGAKMKDLANRINAFTAQDISKVELEGKVEVDFLDSTITLTEEDVEISYQDIPGWSVAHEGTITVALDITISEELKQEGIARDLVNRIQNLRKETGLDVQDKIRISVQKSDETVNIALEKNKKYICLETQALSLELADKVKDATLLDVDDYELLVSIQAEELVKD